MILVHQRDCTKIRLNRFVFLFSTHLYKKHGFEKHLSNALIYKLTLRYKIHIYVVYKRCFAYICISYVS